MSGKERSAPFGKAPISNPKQHGEAMNSVLTKQRVREKPAE